MEKIEWSDEFSVGDALLDKQHQRMISIINALHEQTRQGYSMYDVTRGLMEMVSYSERHFATEELKLEQAGYPDLDQQINEHEAYRDKVSRMFYPAEKDIDELMRFVMEWWKQHILVEDMKYKSWRSDR